MDLRAYYQSIRDVEATIATPFAVVVSRATGAGGVSGALAEVTRRVAAKMVVEGHAELASEEQAAAFLAGLVVARTAALEAAAAQRVEVAVLSADEFRKLRGGGREAGE